MLLAAAGLVSASVAQAEDGQAPLFFGDLSAGTHLLFGSESGEDFYVPMVDLDARLAVQRERFGLQADGEYSGFSLGWVHPEVDLAGAEGSVATFAVTGHLTYAPSDRLKLGAYLGYMRGAVSISDGVDFMNAAVTSLAYGVEAIYQPNESNWIEVSAGLVDPQNLTVESTILFPTLVDLDAFTGYTAAATYTHRFSPRWLASGRVGFTRLTAFGDNINAIGVRGTVTYQCEKWPIALSTTFGYSNVSADGLDGAGAYNVGARLTWSLGTAATGANGQLFTTRRAFDGLF